MLRNLGKPWLLKKMHLLSLKMSLKISKCRYMVTNQNTAQDYSIPEEAKNAQEILSGNSNK